MQHTPVKCWSFYDFVHLSYRHTDTVLSSCSVMVVLQQYVWDNLHKAYPGIQRQGSPTRRMIIMLTQLGKGNVSNTGKFACKHDCKKIS